MALMAKIYPKASNSQWMSSPSSSCSSSMGSNEYVTSKKEVFTIWMKSLVFNGNGCTIYNQQGAIIYRMDNYDHKHRSQVHLMDLQGNLVFTILKKKLSILGCWEGYRNTEEGKPWFQVKKASQILKRGRGSGCEVSMISWENEEQSSLYRIQGFAGKAACKIVNGEGEAVAELTQKQSTSGIVLGSDVMKLVVEEDVDHSLVVGLVVAYSLMNRRM